MAKDSDRLAGHFEAENAGGLFSGLIAEETELERRSLWRIGSWAVAAVSAVVIAVMANQASLGWRRDRLGAADLARQGEQIQSLVGENQNEIRRLASALETLNADRDRLFSRVTILEQGLESVAAFSRQNAPPAPAQAASPQATAPKLTTPAELPSLQSQTALPNTAPVAVAAPEASEKRQESAPPEAHPAAPSPSQPSVASSRASPPNPPVPAQQAGAPAPLPPPIIIPARPHAASPKRVELPKTANTSADVTASVDATRSAPSNLAEPPKTQEPPRIQEPPRAQEPPQELAKPQEAAKTEPQKLQEPPKLQDASESAPKLPVLRTKFAVDIGGANSIAGLRALWRSLAKSNPELGALRPIIVIKENSTGLGMQLRLAAGPLTDAATAAQICAKLIESERSCETTVFDGQRLAMKAEDAPSPTGANSAASSRANPKRAKKEEPPPPPPNTDPSTLSSLFSRKLP
jgi:hypothetical protein